MFTATNNNGFWILPSRNRIENLKRFFEAYKETEADCHGVVLVSHAEFSSYQTSVVLPENWELFPLPDAECGSQGDKMRWFAKSYEYSTASWLGWLNDDQRPVTKNWDRKTIEHLNGSNFVSGNDKWQPHRMVGALAFSKDLLKIFGGFYPAGFHHSYVDDMFETIGRETGSWKKLSDVITIHEHHLRGAAERDSTYQLNDSHLVKDKKAWRNWLLSDYARVKRQIGELQNGQGSSQVRIFS